MGAQEDKTKTVETKQPNVETKQPPKGFLDEIFDKVQDQLKDISYVEVITATGDPTLKINAEAENILNEVTALQILGRTTIELDGDIVMIIPTSKVGVELKVNKEIMEIHKQNVDAAVQNWKSFMDTILGVITFISNLAGLGNVDLRNKLGVTPIVPPK